MNKPVLLIRATGNDQDAAVLKTKSIDAVIDPYLQITCAKSDVAAKTMLDVLLNALVEESPVWLVITSANGAKFFAELVGDENLRHVVSNNTLKFAAVGEASEAALRALGANEILVANPETAKDLAEALVLKAPATVVWPRSAIAMKQFPAILQKAGVTLVDGAVYDTNTVSQEPRTAAAANAGEFAAIVLRSPSAARALASFVNPSTANLRETAIVCLGESTAAAATDLGFRVTKIASNIERAF